MKPQAIKYQQCEPLAGATHKLIHYNLSNINKSGKKNLVALVKKKAYSSSVGTEERAIQL